YYVDYETYKDCDQDSCPGLLPGIDSLSQGVELAIDANSTGDAFTGTAEHPDGTGVTCNWDSENGGFTGCS
ncbi:MAG: hypothetical protein D6780_06125, partial [Candidatus Dadabacteria bacterium]